MEGLWSYRKEVIVLKYILISLIIFLDIINKNLGLCQVIYILSFISLNQIRNFFVKDKLIIKYIIYSLEFIVCIFIANKLGQYKIVAFLPIILDISISFKMIYSIIFTLIINMFLYIFIKDINLIITILSVSPIVILGSAINLETSNKINAQNLYDKLRIKEEQLKKANTELENYINTVEELTVLRERNRISREIHDNVGHSLSTIIIQLGAIEKMIFKNSDISSKMTNNLVDFTKKSLDSVRASVRMMKPREFETYEGIITISEMIKNFEKLSGIKVNFTVSNNKWKLNSDQTMVIYRIIQEFLSNSIRHGNATEVRIFINFLEDGLRIVLKDNGRGCDLIKDGVGLKSIKERVAVWSGSVEYYSSIHNGFELIASLDRGKLSIDEI